MTINTPEYVILVNEKDEPVGTMEKMQAHEQPILHRAFSVFVFNSKKELLLQQRASTKYHSANLWTNTCCSHPRPNETVEQAARRRLQEELGFTTNLQQAFTFTYQASFDNGLHEYEYDYVFIGEYNGELNLNRDEAQDFSYQSLETVSNLLQNKPEIFTEWFKIAYPKLLNYLAK